MLIFLAIAAGFTGWGYYLETHARPAPAIMGVPRKQAIREITGKFRSF